MNLDWEPGACAFKSGPGPVNLSWVLGPVNLN